MKKFELTKVSRDELGSFFSHKVSSEEAPAQKKPTARIKISNSKNSTSSSNNNNNNNNNNDSMRSNSESKKKSGSPVPLPTPLSPSLSRSSSATPLERMKKKRDSPPQNKREKKNMIQYNGRKNNSLNKGEGEEGEEQEEFVDESLFSNSYFAIHAQKKAKKNKKNSEEIDADAFRESSGKSLADLGLANPLPSLNELKDIYKTYSESQRGIHMKGKNPSVAPEQQRKSADPLALEEQNLRFITELQNFDSYNLYLKNGFNLLAYGVGSKEKLLQAFADKFCRDAVSIHISGYHPSAGINEVCCR